MKIAQIAPIWERVPPPKYGGTQRIVYNLTEGLIKAGHRVTLFATGDSKTSAKLISVYPRALYRDNIFWDNYFWPTLNAWAAFERQDEFDLIHYHIDRKTEYIPAFPVAKLLKTPTVFTLHFTILHTPEAEMRRKFLSRFKDLNFISISKYQQKTFPPLNFIGYVHNGINIEEIQFFPKRGRELIWLGRFSRTKGAKEAIQIAKKLKRKLLMGGKLDKLLTDDYKYFKKYVEPHIDSKKIVYLGELDTEGKNKLFSRAEVLLNPLQWDEPFGLVPVEAMAAGVPVIAFRRGAMPELIKDGVNGFLVKPSNIEGMVRAVKRIYEMPEAEYRQMRINCREHVKKNFTVEKMVDGYERVYQKVIANWKKRRKKVL